MSLDFSHTKSIRALLIFFLVLVAPTTCQALSCYPLQDNFFLQCTSGACAGIFRARQVGVPGACAHRTIVEPLHDDEEKLLTPMIASSVRDNKFTGYFHVVLVHKFYGQKPVTATELREAMSQPGIPRTSLMKIEFIGDKVAADALKQEWLNIQDKELEDYRMKRLLDYSSLAICFAVLVFSVMKFRQWANGAPQKNSNLIRLALVLQVVIFALTLLSSIFLFPSWAVDVDLVPLFVIVIWIYEKRMFNQTSKYSGKDV